MRRDAFEEYALVTSLLDYGDSDRVVRLFLRERGRAGAFARAAKRSKKRFAGLAALAHGPVWLSPRAGSDLLSLEQAELTLDVDGFSDPVAMGRGAYVVELCEKLLPEMLPAPDVFDDALATLSRVAAGEGFEALRAFEVRLLSSTGYLFDLFPDGAAPFFDPVTFSLVDGHDERLVPFGPLLQEKMGTLAASPVSAPVELRLEEGRVLATVFATHLRRMGVGPLKSVAFLKSLARGVG